MNPCPRCGGDRVSCACQPRWILEAEIEQRRQAEEAELKREETAGRKVCVNAIEPETPQGIDAAFKLFVYAFEEVARYNHEMMRGKGFWDGRYAIIEACQSVSPELEKLAVKAIKSQLFALHHSELSEGHEGVRKDLQDDHLPHYTMETCELADTIIRIFDHSIAFDLPVAQCIVEKMQYNSKRPRMHGGNKQF